MKTLVALPVYNQEKSIRDIVSRVKVFASDILILDDGSTDGSLGLSHTIGGVQIISHHKNMGYGQTIIDAFRYAMEKGYECVITLDSDGQHEPEEIPQFLEKVLHCDIASGSRFLLPFKVGSDAPPDRYAINMEITKIICGITGYQLTDAFCGFKAYRVEALKKISLTEHGYGMPLQLWIQAWRSGLRMREVPVKLIYSDPTRQFAGSLDDPTTRLAYYKEVLEKELNNSENTLSLMQSKTL
jgi:dolichol-phosphate mannosyltransferase